MKKITYIDDVEIKNKTVLIRVDYNVSQDKQGNITNDKRIVSSLPTLQLLLKNNNKLILMSHLGKPKGRDMVFSMKPVAERLQQYFPDYKVTLVNDFLVDKELLSKQTEKDIYILENTRFYEGEKKNDPEFSKQLASLADIYVSDAFGSVHRAHASVVGVAQFLPSYGGLLLKKEVESIYKATNNPLRPLVAVIGGAKVSTKIGLIDKLLELSDYLIIGGAMANTFGCAMGYEVGKSLYEKEFVGKAKELLEKAKKMGNNKLILPVDRVVGNAEDLNNPGIVKKVSEIGINDDILDIGPESIKLFDQYIQKAKTIIWNGPVGYFENPQYRIGTDAIYDSIIKNKGVISVFGGGDTLTAIKGKKDNDKITHISTGGGAMLELIEKGTLPGIEALKR
jgi:phosphoglycerate kinase